MERKEGWKVKRKEGKKNNEIKKNYIKLTYLEKSLVCR